MSLPATIKPSWANWIFSSSASAWNWLQYQVLHSSEPLAFEILIEKIRSDCKVVSDETANIKLLQLYKNGDVDKNIVSLLVANRLVPVDDKSDENQNKRQLQVNDSNIHCADETLVDEKNHPELSESLPQLNTVEEATTNFQITEYEASEQRESGIQDLPQSIGSPTQRDTKKDSANTNSKSKKIRVDSGKVELSSKGIMHDTAVSAASKDDLSKLKLTELKQVARTQGIRGYYKYRSDDLRQLIREARQREAPEAENVPPLRKE